MKLKFEAETTLKYKFQPAALPYCTSDTKHCEKLCKSLRLFFNRLAGLNKIFLPIVLQPGNFLLHLHSASEEEDK